ncbi:MAG: methyltransferase domain-containing protein [Granulosicoccus sp.]
MIRPDLARTPLACPIDGLALEVAEHGLACARKHNYNVSRHGYVNLLPVRLKPSKDPGDNRDMVEARRAVVDHGVFEPFAQALSAVVCASAQQVDKDLPLLVDAGCGEGYYTAALSSSLRSKASLQNFAVLGVDISKWAITAAAKRHLYAAWAVGNNKRLPVLKGAASIITSLFGFETWHPWADLQHAGQIVVTASAGPQHLIELRKLIYETVIVHEVPDNAEALAAGYRQTGDSRVEFSSQINDPAIVANILAMTPHGHRVGTDSRTSLDTSVVSELTMDIVIRLYQRT